MYALISTVKGEEVSFTTKVRSLFCPESTLVPIKLAKRI